MFQKHEVKRENPAAGFPGCPIYKFFFLPFSFFLLLHCVRMLYRYFISPN